MNQDAINQQWYQKALDEFAALNGKQNEEALLSLSFDLLWPLLALIDELAMAPRGVSHEMQEQILRARDQILPRIESKLLEARNRVRETSPSAVRLQAIIERVRVA